jgi:hypothetical protein
MVRLPYVTALTTLFSYGLLFAFGQLRDFFRRILDARKPSNLKVRCPLPGCVALAAPSHAGWLLAVAFSAGLRADLLGTRGFLHATPLPPHPGEATDNVALHIPF